MISNKEEYQTLLNLYKNHIKYDEFTEGAQSQFWADIKMCSKDTKEYDLDGLKGYIKTTEPKEVFDEFVKESKKKAKSSMKKEKKEEEEIIYTSLILFDDKIAEECYDTEKGEVFFSVYNTKDKTISKIPEIILNGVKHKPIRDEEVIKKAILLPNKAEEYGNDKELDELIKKFINKWLDIPKNVAQFALWNIKRSWVFERFHTLNYLRALGDTGMGKTRFLDTLGYIHYKPISTSGATTAAAIFRIAEKWKGTLIMDEADFSKSDESQIIIKIINHGYEKGKFIMRCDKEDYNKVNFFDPYCPKILATRRTFEDKATESRCITHVMDGTERMDIPLNINQSFWNETLILRNKLLLWRFKNYYKINPESVSDFDLGNIEPRVKQIVSSFVNLFNNDTKQLEEFKLFINEYQKDLVDERRNSFEGVIIESIFNLINDGQFDFDAKDIIETGNITNNKGVLIKPRSLNSTLKGLGFAKTVRKRVGEKIKRCIPMKPGHIKKLFERYGFKRDDVNGCDGVLPDSLFYKNKENHIQKEDFDKNTKDLSFPVEQANEKKGGVTVTTVPTDNNVTLDFIRNNPECSFLMVSTKLKINEEKLDKIIKKLKETGQIFEPKVDKFMVV